MRASVIIPTYNKVDRLSLVLEAYKLQTEETSDYEVIVVDDGSTDGTQNFIENFKSSLNIKYCHQPNGGRSTARNHGISLAGADLIIFCDDDLIVPKEFISAHVDLHRRDQADVVHGAIYNLPYLKFFKNPETGELFQQGEERTELDYLKRYLLTKADLINMEKIEQQKKTTQFERLIQSTFNSETTALQWLSFTGGNVSCTKKFLEKAGGFNETLGKKWGCEDIELGYRLYKNNARFLYSYNAFNYHMAHVRKTFKGEVEESVHNFYLLHPDKCILHLAKLLLGEIRSAEEYMDYIAEREGNNEIMSGLMEKTVAWK